MFEINNLKKQQTKIESNPSILLMLSYFFIFQNYICINSFSERTNIIIIIISYPRAV